VRAALPRKMSPVPTGLEAQWTPGDEEKRPFSWSELNPGGPVRSLVTLETELPRITALHTYLGHFFALSTRINSNLDCTNE
jgi:hypothetical protein